MQIAKLIAQDSTQTDSLASGYTAVQILFIGPNMSIQAKPVVIRLDHLRSKARKKRDEMFDNGILIRCLQLPHT